MNKKVRSALLREVHRSIETAATDAASELRTGEADLAYPPNAGLTDDERAALARLRVDDAAECAIRKVVVYAAMAPVFHLFALFDCVADPDGFDEWLGVVLRPASDEASSMLHDDFFDSYWEFGKRDLILGGGSILLSNFAVQRSR